MRAPAPAACPARLLQVRFYEGNPMSKYYDPVEALPRAELENMQLAKLQILTRYVADNSPFYQKKFEDNKIRPEDIRSLDDFRKIPFTYKQDLRNEYPYGLLAVSKDEIVRLHASSGTTGVATVVLHTKEDIDDWAELMARSFYAAGVRRTDILQNMSGYGMFTGGLGIHYGSERLGCLTVPSGPGNTNRQIQFIKDFGTTVVHIIPSYALHVAAHLNKHNIDPKSLPWRIALIGAEPHTEETRRKVEKFLGLKAYNSYGLSEMNGPGVAFECTQQSGMHIWEDAFFAEIVDPDTNEPMPDGELGELILTSLNRRGMPLLRYRTRDLTRFLPSTCPCGRTHRRIDRIFGRCDDMLIIKGVNIYPMQIERVLMSMPEAGENYLIELYKEGPVDQMRVKVEIREEYFRDDMRALHALRDKIAAALRDEILITPKVELVEYNSIPHGEGKAKRVVDLRDCE